VTADPRLALLDDIGTDGAAADLLERFDSTAVVIDTDPEHPDLALSIANLAARLWSNVRVVGKGGAIDVPLFGSGPISEVADRLVRATTYGTPSTPTTQLVVAVGASATSANLRVTADEWSVRLSGSTISSLGGAPGPATTAAASLVVAELFRLTAPELPGVRLGAETFEWNLVDYGLTLTRIRPSAAIVEATCFGAGSVGSSFVLAMILSRAGGDIHLVDDDLLQVRNRLRYPLWIGPRQGSKVRWIAEVADGGPLRIHPQHARAADHIDRLERFPPLAISAVDSGEARRDIADALARETLNAGVDGLRFHVSRHRFNDGCACVYCPYLDVAPPMSQVNVYTELTGLDASRAIQLLNGERLTEHDVRTMTAAGRLGTDDSQDLVGGRIEDVARARLYAAAAIPGASGVAVSAPFVSALAGAILAAEAIKTPMSDLVLDRRVDIDLSGWPTGFKSRPPQDTTGRCLCRSVLRQDAYREAWGTII
jgi:hypothetical protein